jgi:glycosyltransferase involved in cell wall biosynthesis
MKVITIIPAYNEGNVIKTVVGNALKYSDVLVVDDGSTDQTSNLAREAGAMVVKHSQNRGKGAAIKTGLKKALNDDYQALVLMDGDGQHDPGHIPLLASGINGADMVMGSRFKEGVPEGMALQRRLSNNLTTKLMGYVTGYRLTDSQCGFRAISPLAARLFLDVPYNDYVYESEVLYLASKKKLLIDEKPIPCTYNDEKSYITGINIFNYIIFILKLLSRKLKRED